MKPRFIKIFYSLSAIEGLLAVAWMLREPSMARNAGLFGYSFSRLAIAGVALLPALVFTGLALRSLFDSSWAYRHAIAYDKKFRQDDRLQVVLFWLAAGFIVGLVGLAIWQTPLFQTYESYAAYFGNVLPLFESIQSIVQRIILLPLWGLAICLQSLLLLVFAYNERLNQPGFWQFRSLYPSMLVLGAGSLSILHWLILTLQVPVELFLPSWYWEPLAKGFSIRDGLFISFSGLALWLMLRIQENPKPVRRSLIALVLFGYAFQVGFGFIEGGGLEAIRLRYADTHHKSHAVKVTEERLDPLEVIVEYEDRFGQSMFQSTKPPGLMLVYLFAERVSGFLDPQPSLQGRFLALTRMMSFVFPLINFLVVVVLYAFMRRFYREEDAMLPSMLYLLAPNILLIPLFMDNVLYPLVFMLGALVAVVVVRRQSLLLAVVAGIFLYLATFISFSLLALAPLFILMIAADHYLHWEDRRLRQPVKLALAMCVGFLGIFLLFQNLLGYDLVTRYNTAMDVHVNFDFYERVDQAQPGEQERLLSVGKIFSAMWANNIEFAAAVGFPLYLLFLAGAVRTSINFLRRRANMVDAALVSIFGTFIALNLFGQTQGEVARLWMFWLPMVVLFAALELRKAFSDQKRAFVLLALAQLITIFLTFKFQDLLV